MDDMVQGKQMKVLEMCPFIIYVGVACNSLSHIIQRKNDRWPTILLRLALNTYSNRKYVIIFGNSGAYKSFYHEIL